MPGGTEPPPAQPPAAPAQQGAALARPGEDRGPRAPPDWPQPMDATGGVGGRSNRSAGGRGRHKITRPRHFRGLHLAQFRQSGRIGYRERQRETAPDDWNC